MNAPTERRRSLRLPTPGMLATLAAERVRLLDLGDTGARVETRQWLAPGRTYVLRFDDPDFRIAGRVAHARLARLEREDGGLRPVFEAGFDFAAAPFAARELLGGVMARLAATAPLEPLLPELRVEAG